MPIFEGEVPVVGRVHVSHLVGGPAVCLWKVGASAESSVAFVTFWEVHVSGRCPSGFVRILLVDPRFEDGALVNLDHYGPDDASKRIGAVLTGAATVVKGA